jgi:hypothetical protein
LDFIKTKWPVEPEEVALQKEELREKWEPNEHIEKFVSSGEGRL